MRENYPFRKCLCITACCFDGRKKKLVEERKWKDFQKEEDAVSVKKTQKMKFIIGAIQ